MTEQEMEDGRIILGLKKKNRELKEQLDLADLLLTDADGRASWWKMLSEYQAKYIKTK